MTREYQVGDVVMVVAKVEKEEGWDNVWTDLMDEYLTHGYTVCAVDAMGVQLEAEEIFAFPPSSLKLVRAVQGAVS